MNRAMRTVPQPAIDLTEMNKLYNFKRIPGAQRRGKYVGFRVTDVGLQLSSGFFELLGKPCTVDVVFDSDAKVFGLIPNTGAYRVGASVEGRSSASMTVSGRLFSKYMPKGRYVFDSLTDGGMFTLTKQAYD